MHAHVLDANGVILQTIVVESLDFMPGLVDASIGGQPGDRIAGNMVISAQPAPLPPTVDEYRAAIQRMLDEKVKERRYYDIMSACTYANSTNPVFKAEAEACIVWRDAVWAKAYEVLDQVESGAALQPTIPGLLAMLPKLTWPA